MINPPLMCFLINGLRWTGLEFTIFEYCHTDAPIIKISVVNSNILKNGSRVIRIRQIGNLSAFNHPYPFRMHFITAIASPASSFRNGTTSQSPNISMINIMIIRNHYGWSILHCITETPSENPVLL